jgi:ABC-2 type transport system permease protein
VAFVSKVLSVSVKTFKELIRQRRTLMFTIAFPVVFMLIFGLVFGHAQATTYKVAVLNEDQGPLGAQYAAGLGSLKYSDGKQLVQLVSASDLAAAKKDLSDRKVNLVLRVPANFTQGLTPTTSGASGTGLPVGNQPTQRAPPPGSQVDVTIDAASPDSQAASQIVDAYTQAFAAKASGQPPLVTQARDTVTSSDLTFFDIIAPGILVYGVLMMVPQAAALLARESETRTLDRLKLSRVRTWELLLGVSLAQLALGTVALGASLLTAVALGFHPQGNLALGLVVALVAATSTIGMGMIIAAFAKSRDDAANAGALFAVPASFLSGAFFTIPAVNLFTVGGQAIGLYDILPSTHAVKALRAILTFGQPLGEQLFELAALVALAAVFFVVGAWLFTQRRMRTVT